MVYNYFEIISLFNQIVKYYVKHNVIQSVKDYEMCFF